MIRRPPRSTQSRSSAASDVYKRQPQELLGALRVQAESRDEPVELETGVDNGATDEAALMAAALAGGAATPAAALRFASVMPAPTAVLGEPTAVTAEPTKLLPGGAEAPGTPAGETEPGFDREFRALAPPTGEEELADEENPTDGEYEPPVPRHRFGSLLALLLAVCAGAALRPGWAAMAVVAGLLVFRTVGSNVAALHERRSARGGERSADRLRAVLASPWHFLRAIVGLLPSIIVGASVAIVVGCLLYTSPSPRD